MEENSNNVALDNGLIDKKLNFEYATTGQRLLHFIIDSICIYLLVFIVSFTMAIIGLQNVVLFLYSYPISLGCYFIYYIALEYYTGKTVGKLITGTVLRTESLEKPSLKTVIIRTLSRIIPFEAISCIGNGSGWHDSLPGTMVVRLTERE